MKTSNFANNQRYGLSGISISRYPATRNGFTGPEFPPLMPSAQLLAWYKEHGDWAAYREQYSRQLGCLDAQSVWDELMLISGACLGLTQEPILLCYESAKTLDTNPCHRRLVAAWFERELGILVPEWSREVAA